MARTLPPAHAIERLGQVIVGADLETEDAIDASPRAVSKRTDRRLLAQCL